MHKRFIGGFGLAAVMALVGAISAAPASAAGCIAAPNGMTAALVNPGAVTGATVDATGCDIGIYYSAPGSVTTSDVSKALKFGVFVDGTSVTITGSTVHDIGDSPLNGNQHGVGVSYRNDATGSVANSTISRYQKGGILVRGENTAVDVTGSTVKGLGPVSFIAQNGIQYDTGAAGTIADNLVRDHEYTGCSAKDAQKTGCTWYVDVGILLIDVDPAEVKTFNNTYRDNQRNHWLFTSSSQG